MIIRAVCLSLLLAMPVHAGDITGTAIVLLTYDQHCGAPKLPPAKKYALVELASAENQQSYGATVLSLQASVAAYVELEGINRDNAGFCSKIAPMVRELQ